MYKYCVLFKKIVDQELFAEYLADIMRETDGKWIGFSRGESNEGSVYLEKRVDVAQIMLWTDNHNLSGGHFDSYTTDKKIPKEYYRHYGANREPFNQLKPNKYYIAAEIKGLI